MDEPFATNDAFYAFLDSLAVTLQGTPLAEHGRKIHFLLHEVSWTTSSELLAELGSVLVAARQRAGPEIPAVVQADIDRCVSAIRRAWPGINLTAGS